MMCCKYLTFIALCTFLVGCDQATLMKRFVAPGDETLARRYAQELRNGEYDQIEPHLDSSIADSDVHETLVHMTEFFPKEEPISIKVVGAHQSHGADLSSSDITLEYQFSSKWLLVGVAIQTKGDIRTITGLHVVPISNSLENLNKFTLGGKNAVHYTVLACAIAAFFFSLWVCVLAIRSKQVRFKWLWVVFTLVGVSRFGINWNTGESNFTLLAIQIPCFSAAHQLYSPWIIAAYFPLGAFLFLNQRWLMKIRGESIPPPSPVPERSTSVF